MFALCGPRNKGDAPASLFTEFQRPVPGPMR